MDFELSLMAFNGLGRTFDEQRVQFMTADGEDFLTSDGDNLLVQPGDGDE
jgi:hypothetical protein